MKYDKLDCGIILIDLSGFTNLLYKSKNNDKYMEIIIKAIDKMFCDYIDYDEKDDDIQIINTTGDGFFAISFGKDPCLSAINFSKNIEDHFSKEIKPLIKSLDLNENINLRIALHYGSVYKIHIPNFSSENNTIYISDDLNMTARIINCQTARMHTYALSKSFYKKFFGDPSAVPYECILDENEYPEKIEIFKLEETMRYK